MVKQAKFQNLKDLMQPGIRHFLAKILIEDNLTLNNIINSTICEDFLKNNGFNMQQSNTTITTKVVEYFYLKREQLVLKIKKLVYNGTRFSLTTDE